MPKRPSRPKAGKPKRSAPRASVARRAKPAATAAAPAARPPEDPRRRRLLAEFGEAVEAMQRRRWRDAIALFEHVIGRADDEAEIGDRARQYVELCRKRRAEERSPVAEEDPYLAAVVAKNAGEFDRALALCRRGGRQRRDEKMAYLAAAILALQGKADEAAELLEIAIHRNPKNRVLALLDPDFADLRHRTEFVRLLRV